MMVRRISSRRRGQSVACFTRDPSANRNGSGNSSIEGRSSTGGTLPARAGVARRRQSPCRHRLAEILDRTASQYSRRDKEIEVGHLPLRAVVLEEPAEAG